MSMRYLKRSKIKIKGAAIDVFTSEPPNNPLLNLPDEFRDNIILTPHIGGITVQSWSGIFKVLD